MLTKTTGYTYPISGTPYSRTRLVVLERQLPGAVGLHAHAERTASLMASAR